MLFVYLLVLVLYAGGLSAENTTLTPEMCSPDCKSCAKLWHVCHRKEGAICAMKDMLVDLDSPTCEFKGCPVGETKLPIGSEMQCAPVNPLTNGTIPDGWWWKGCSEQLYINCGNYLPICIYTVTLQSYNQTAGGCIYDAGCPAGTHPCKVENGTECISYDDLKSVLWTKEGEECIRATPEEKAAARATPTTAPTAAQEETEPKETSPASHPSWLLVNTIFIVLATKIAAAFV